MENEKTPNNISQHM
jgi:hypothetical protein